MRRFGKWLMVVGFIVPCLITAFFMSRAFARFDQDHDQHGRDQAMQAEISATMKITMIGVPIGLLGAGCWLIAVVRQANQYLQSSPNQPNT